MSDLKNMSNESLILPTVGPTNLHIRVKEEDRIDGFDDPNSLQSGFYIQWKNTGKWIPVFRPDVECTNGIIHVIDAPLIRDNDITNSAPSSKKVSFETTMTLMMIMMSLLLGVVTVSQEL
ncbi:fasciclin-1-like [Toxorhynchites rutilus septentrionalis]|uniref:fasciclin-1-like n=1 Tax=Toxorhynchites rutilus septentrionalis TaxID=329112 RepID=UPI0024790BF8|nr:fasciclin-1-like [Toxorhynchites rutilus septentrionalis]